ncbi:MAG: adenosylcobalamin-dependent ribonucleoside-diphosphate reductase [bacterium]|nr:adenosylcobalamin-dependent ribonucleoside-diphosphate reductase [bacterium]
MTISNAVLPTISKMIWEKKYALKSDDGSLIDLRVEDSWRRVAKAVAKAEKKVDRAKWRKRFYEAMEDFAFLPGGRILAGAGAGRQLTLFNCFVMNQIEDDTSSIFETLREGALTMQQGGGIGLDFSTLRPAGALVRGVGADAAGPVSFLHVFDTMCGTIQSSGARRGAMMATLRVDHPDIEKFVDAKSQSGQLNNFNLSVLISDAFMKAVDEEVDWRLFFDGKTYGTVKATRLFDKIMRATYERAEPGVLFMDQLNKRNKLSYCETIYATNPCGEQPLPPYGACILGSINLTRLIKQPFEKEARLDEARLVELVRVAVRFLDNIIDISGYPLKAQKKEARAKRRIGLGITGLADALAMCGERYGDKAARELAARWMSLVQNTAYLASADLAREKGSFPLYDATQHLGSPEWTFLQKETRKHVEEHGLRNGLLTSIAPTGTISLLAGNVSGGIEPIFDLSYQRSFRDHNGLSHDEQIEDYTYNLYKQLHGADASLPDSFTTVADLTPGDHLAMQSALQPFVDSAISKTINCSQDISFSSFKSIYADAYVLGLKGCTTYRPNAITGSVLKSGSDTDSGKKPVDVTIDDQPQDTGAVTTQSALPLPALHGLQKATYNLSQSGNDVHYLSDPMERGATLAGYTYKLRWPDSDHATYITINDVILNKRRRPFEIFINSKNLEHYAWTVALTRMISAVFRRGGDVSFVVEELKAVFDPRGGQWMNGHYVPSLLAAIGEVVEKHLIDTGFLLQSGGEEKGEREMKASKARYCPKCSQPALVYQEGCHNCRSCGYSKCS